MTSPETPHGAPPPIQLSQFSGHANTSAEQNINLFRGTVSFAVPLVSLPGRSGLGLDLTASYSSRVTGNVQKTNRTAPTGILGLGWTLGLDRIIATYGTAGLKDSATYYAISGGTQSRLHPVERSWKRAILPRTHTSLLQNGPLDPALIDALAEQGVAIASTAFLRMQGSPQTWLLTDPFFEFCLVLKHTDDHIQVFDGGTAYELEQFDFSRIRYYERFEKWAITHTNGLTTVFGGHVSTEANGNATSAGSSITWAVRWHTFSGPSSLTHDHTGKRLQQQYPTAWYVSARTAPNTDSCRYTYTPVEQAVGNNGLHYTKALYLHSITDMFGRTVTLNYAEKLYGSGYYDQREYSDPYKAVPNTTPDAYQSRYETLYLASLHVTDAEGTLLQKVTLSYEVTVFGNIPSTAPPTYVGDLAKRVLVKITRTLGPYTQDQYTQDQYTQDKGHALPPMCFTYHRTPSLNPGALATKVAAEGAIERYAYQKVDLPYALRTFDLPSPLSQASPLVWFGPNYTVIIWVNALQWTLSVLTWVGRWVQWTLPSLPIEQSIARDDVRVVLQADFFTVDYSTTNQENSSVLFFHKDPEVLGGWIGTHRTPLVLTTPHRQVVAGKHFIALTYQGCTAVDRYTWSIKDKQWVCSSLPAPTVATDPQTYHVALGAASHSLVVLYYQRNAPPRAKDNRMQISYLDARHTWCLGEECHVPGLAVTETHLPKSLTITHTGWCVAIMALIHDSNDRASYDLSLYTWGHTLTYKAASETRYAWNAPFHTRIQIPKTSRGTHVHPASLIVTPTGMVACGPYILRYNGAEWLENDALALKSLVTDDTRFWFAYGTDIALKAENSPTHVQADALVFDPNTHVTTWTAPSHVLHRGQPTSDHMHRYLPTTGGDYATYNGAIYYRGSSSAWTNALTQAVTHLPESVDHASFLNQGVDFFVYHLTPPTASPTLHALVMDQGASVTQEAIPQRFVTPPPLPQPPLPTGRSLAGPQTLVTFASPTEDFEHATALTVHRVFDDSLVQPISDFPIATVTTENGFDAQTRTYTFNTVSATLDPTGSVCTYDQSEVTLGSQGTARFQYHNSAGLNLPDHNPTAPALLDGQLLEKSLYDVAGTCVAQQTNTWTVGRHITDPTSGETTPLKGLFLHALRTSHTVEAATTVQTFDYDPGSGAVVSTTVQTSNARGQTEHRIRITTPAYTRYPDMAHLHMLHAIADLTHTIVIEGEAPQQHKQQYMHWARFPSVPLPSVPLPSVPLPRAPLLPTVPPRAHTSEAPHRLWLPSPSQNFLRQHPGSASPLDDATQWHQIHQITRRNPYGHTLEKRDAGTITQSIIYDRFYRMKVATVSGASVAADEAYYYGFEGYEDPGSWHLDVHRTPVVSDLCVTGQRCLSIPAGVTGVSLQLRPGNRTQTYLFSCWMAQDPGPMDPPAPLVTGGWHVTYTDEVGNATRPPTALPLTQAGWTYYHVPIICTNGTHTLTLTPYNTAPGLRESSTPAPSPTLYIDHVAFSPLAAPIRAKVYDITRDVITAEVGPYNEVTHFVYDGLRRHVARTNQFQEVIQATHPYLSRQDHPTFTAHHPNSQITVQPTGRTHYERFRNKGVWSHAFRSATPDLWHSQDGNLHYRGTTFGALTCIAPVLTENYMMQMQIIMATATVGFAIGDDISVTWDPEQTTWTLHDHIHDTRLNQPGTDHPPNGTWLVVLSQAALVFVVNGRVIFDYVPDRLPRGAPALLATGPITVSDFVIAGGPQIGITYLDGAGHVRQAHVLEGRTAQVSTTLFDTNGTPAVQVKPVPYDGGTGALLTYRDDVVTAFDWTTGLLEGRAAHTHPDDLGYPYQRHMPERSPLRRQHQTGQAGRDVAIIQGPDLAPLNPHITTHIYGGSTVDSVLQALGLTAERVMVQQVRDPNGLYTTTVTNTLGHVLAQTVGTEDNPAATRTTYGIVYTAEGSTEWMRLPNFYAPPPGSEPSDWVQQVTRNLLGQVIETRGPNHDHQLFLFNTAGHVRFSQDRAQAAAGRILYHTYDRYGRRIETGLVTMAWDPTALHSLADQNDWPHKGDTTYPFVPVKTTTYDSAGTEVNGLGQVTTVTLHDETTGEALTTLLYDYDAVGQISATTTIHAQTGTHHVTRFAYNTQGQVQRTTYDSGFILDMTRDALGRTTVLSDGTSGRLLAHYTYDAHDRITQQTLLPEDQNPTPITYTYNSPGWITRLAVPGVFEHTVNYTSGGYKGAGFYTGRIAAVTTQFAGRGLADDFPKRVDMALAYDPLGRMTTAHVTTPEGVCPGGCLAWSFGLSTATVYDAHGNLRQAEDGGTPQTYTYAPGTEYTLNTTGTTATDFAFGPDGTMTRATPRGITQIETTLVTKRPTTLHTAEAGPVDLLYDPLGNRCRKKTARGTRTYARGLNGWPLTEWIHPTPSAENVPHPTGNSTDYLYGPKGLFAIRRQGQIYPVLLDHQHSVRALLNPDGEIICAIHYTAFGKPIAFSGDRSALTRLFSGYEYDPETGLYDAAARLYDPDLKRFYAPDPKRQFSSPYVYVNNDPVSMVDPNGEEAWWAIVLGALTGLAATVATGGAGALLFGMEEGALSLGATTAVAATAGAVGSVVGDATTAGAAGEKITAHRLLVDALSGAAGGAVGEILGGTTASLAMRMTLGKGRTAAQITAVGAVASGLVGGMGGAATSGAVASLMTHQKFLSLGQATNILSAGLFGGFGGALMASGTHFGFFGMMPVPLGQDDFHLFSPVKRQLCDFRMVSFDPDSLDLYDAGVHFLNTTGTTFHDVIDLHGIGRFVFPKTIDGHLRPLSSRLFATYMRQYDNGSWVANGQNLPPIKLSCCFSALPGIGSTGRQIANALGRTTQGCINVVYFPIGQTDWQWIRFKP